jgi:hypothetical protein
MSLSSISRDLPRKELADDDGRSLFTTSRNEVRLSRLFERTEREASLLLLLDIGCGDKKLLEVDGRELCSCADFLLHNLGRLIQDGDNRSFEGTDSVDMMRSDMWKAAEDQGFYAL